MAATKIYQLRGPFEAGKSYSLEDKKGIKHIGIQIPYSEPKRFISMEQYRHNHSDDEAEKSLRWDYNPDKKLWDNGDIEIKCSYYDNIGTQITPKGQNFSISESCILEFDELFSDNAKMASITISFKRDLPRETIIDIVYIEES